jgi:O-antigen/teichoic acid export membrane protein
MLGAVIFLSHTAVAAYGGRLLAAALVIAFYLRWVRKRLQFARGSIHPPALKEGLIYGMPLVLNEMIAVALVTLDRLMIKGISGDFADVGIYSIGAALAMQVSTFTNLTVFEAFTPMANRLFVTEGPAAVRALKKRLLVPMTYAALGCASLVWCFGADLIIALSGHAKSESGPVFALAGVVNCLQPLLLVAGYGLLLEKRSTKVLALMCGTLVINGVLNYFWIPMFGVMGAVYATAISSAAMAIAHCAWVPRELLQLPDGRTVATAAGAAGVFLAGETLSGLFGLSPGWPRLLIGSSALVMIYGSLVWLLDPRLRQLITDWRRQRGATAR